MFEITIKGNSLGDLGRNILLMAAQFQATVPTEEEARPAKPAARRSAPKETAADLEPSRPTTAEDAELERELNEPVPPAPATANTIVDAGTGQPAGGEAEATVKMTASEVRAAAAKLAAKDTPKLGELLKKHGAAKLSEVSPENLAAFAADVLEALG